MNVAKFDLDTGEHRYYGWCEYIYSPGEKPDRISPGEPESTEIGKIDLTTVHEQQTIEIDGKAETLQMMVYPSGAGGVPQCPDGHDYYVRQMRDSDTIMDRLRMICLLTYHEERGT